MGAGERLTETALQKTAAYLAAAFAAFLAIAETVRNWGDWQWWPFWLVDYVAAILLVSGAVLTLRGAPLGPRVLAGAWGFTSAMFYMSFWSHVARLGQPADGNVAGPLTVIVGIMGAVALTGFVLSLRSKSRHAARSL